MFTQNSLWRLPGPTRHLPGKLPIILTSSQTGPEKVYLFWHPLLDPQCQMVLQPPTVTNLLVGGVSTWTWSPVIVSRLLGSGYTELNIR